MIAGRGRHSREEADEQAVLLGQAETSLSIGEGSGSMRDIHASLAESFVEAVNVVHFEAEPPAFAASHVRGLKYLDRTASGCEGRDALSAWAITQFGRLQPP